MTSDSRLAGWERRSEWPLAGTAVVFLIAYAAPIVQPELSSSWQAACGYVVAATWVLFALDYVVRLGLAERRSEFVRRHVVDLAILVLPVLRPLRLLRLITVLAVMNRAGSRRLRGRVVTYAAFGTALLMVCGALAVTDAEREAPGSNIANFGDALWWAMTTMTTVGYGDRFPVTPTGRLIAAALMVGGIALLGVVTATLASWMVEKVSDANEAEEAETRSQVDELAEEVRALRSELRRSRHGEPIPGDEATGAAPTSRS